MLTERHTFSDSVAGLALMLHCTRSLRRAGFKTRATVEVFHRFTLHILHATPAPRESRKERGLHGA